MKAWRRRVEGTEAHDGGVGRRCDVWKEGGRGVGEGRRRGREVGAGKEGEGGKAACGGARRQWGGSVGEGREAAWVGDGGATEGGRAGEG
ncbi:uncharacterized protein A4U43_C02F12310, partial [Asparagus officinalis]